jgi:hypothetical protein
MRVIQSGIVRCFLIAAGCLFVGICINAAVGIPLWRPGWLASFLLLLTIYATMHIIALSVAVLLLRVASKSVLPTLFLVFSLALLLASIALTFQTKGIHLFVIFSSSLSLMALDYFVRVGKRRGDE